MKGDAAVQIYASTEDGMADIEIFTAESNNGLLSINVDYNDKNNGIESHYFYLLDDSEYIIEDKSYSGQGWYVQYKGEQSFTLITQDKAETAFQTIEGTFIVEEAESTEQQQKLDLANKYLSDVLVKVN